MVPNGITICRTDKDLGPATKVLPAAGALRGHNVDLLFCDDDKIYDLDWHERFKKASNEHLGCCIVEVGRTFPDIADTHRPADRLPRARLKKKDWRYRMVRVLTLTLYKPRRDYDGGFVDQFSAFAGVLVRPEWFDDTAFEIPDNMWMVDDPWLSGHLERNGVPIWRIGLPVRPPSANRDNLDALGDLVVDGHDRIRSDLLVIEYMRNKYGIWKKGGRPDLNFSDMPKEMRVLARMRLDELQDQMPIP